ncbi:MAG: rhomboid family intramembrane serine protease [Acidobacteria bacterium]|nr:rhomboid family intramembrane serine protease [Acidobacteriota bacterium]
MSEFATAPPPRPRRRRRTPAALFLICAILAGFAIEILTGAWRNGERLALLGATIPEAVRAGQYWRLVTAMFLHGDGTVGGDLLHLAVNLFALYQLGPLYELMFGTRRFLIIYFSAGIVASLTSVLHNAGASVGASGAIFGILGAFISSILRSPRWRHDRMGRSIVKQCIFWAALNLIVVSRFPQIDNAAHIGGLVAGLLLGAILPRHVPPPPPAAVVVDVKPFDDRV